LHNFGRPEQGYLSMGNSSTTVLPQGSKKRSKQGQANLSRKPLQELIDRLASNTSDLALRRRYHRGAYDLERDYVLTKTVLGVGINGGVRLAHAHGCSHRRFAVKTVDLSTQNRGASLIGELASEVDIMLSVDHPHIVRLVDVYETKAELHFVMECAEGGELFDRMVQQGNFSEKDASEAARQMLCVVSYLHGQGIVHRDLKPENFLYESKGSSHLKLTDFGFSRYWDGSSPMWERCGTLAYTPPEGLQRSYSSKIDMWSLGVIVFMLLSGYAPFEGGQAQLFSAIAVGKYTWRPDYWRHVSSDGINFVKSLLCFDPGDRPAAASSLKHQWIAARGHAWLPAPLPLHLDVLRGLHQFQCASKLQRSCLLTMARSMTHVDIGKKVRNYFLRVDAANDGMIDASHLARTVAASGSADDVEILEALNALGHNAVFSYSEFLAAMVPSLIKPEEALCLETFRRFDSVSEDNVCCIEQLSFQDFSQIVYGTISPPKIAKKTYVSFEDLHNDCEEATPAASFLATAPGRLKKRRRWVAKMKRWWAKLGQQSSSVTPAAHQELSSDVFSTEMTLLYGYPIVPMIFNGDETCYF